ncbi:hypothetical protein N9544_05900 [Flavobacteriales bacterium]|nr:hypothetical protein [Flavobacteriales bacterium]
MKKPTKIVLIITLVYCALATYELCSMPTGFKKSHYSIFPEWIEISLIPGYIIGLILSKGVGIGKWGVIIGQISSFFILFFFFKAIVNWIVNAFQKRKN